MAKQVGIVVYRYQTSDPLGEKTAVGNVCAGNVQKTCEFLCGNPDIHSQVGGIPVDGHHLWRYRMKSWRRPKNTTTTTIMNGARISPVTAVIKGTSNILCTRIYRHDGRGTSVPPVYRAHVISDLFMTRETADDHNIRASRTP